jgi:hypothetical protein
MYDVPMLHASQLGVKNGIVACMATFPERFNTLPVVLESITGQVDAVYVYVNQSDRMPACLNHPKVRAFLGKDTAGDLSANGKVFGLQFVRDSYVFLIDDDFIFPPEYVAVLKNIIDRFGRRVCVGVHGSIFAPAARWYFERSTTYDWQSELAEYKMVQMLGSGCLAFHQQGLQAKFDDFLPRVMVDLTFAIKARQQGIPMLAVKRPRRWIGYLGHRGLYDSFVRGMTWHTAAMQEHQPWSAEVYMDLIRDFFEAEFGGWDPLLARRLQFDDEVAQALSTGDPPPSWGRTTAALALRNRFLELIASGGAREGDRLIQR